MNITILAAGSRGDVQPYIALGTGLQQAGHTVRVACEKSFEPLVREYNLEYARLRAEFAALAQTDKGKAAVSGKSSLSLLKEVKPMLRNMLDDAWEVAGESQAVIYHPKSLAGYHLAEKLGIPGFLAMALPAYSPTREFTNPAFGGGDYGGWINRMSYSLMINVAVLPYKGIVNDWRREKLGLPPYKQDQVLRGQPVPKLYGYSRHVLPNAADWDGFTHVTGYWFLPPSRDWQPPADLLTFLDAGPPPVYAGFGSMATQDAEQFTRTFVEAGRAARQRLILATGWGGMAASRLPEEVFMLEAAPHDWLFPRCAAVIHHGGAGTTGAGLRAGKPTLVCPFIADQPFWGRRVQALGVGPQPIPHKKLNVENLAQALRTLTTDAEMRQRAEVLGEKIHQEDGIARAVEVISAGLRAHS